MTFEELISITRTPLDCACEGNGVVLSSQAPCAEHFLYGTSEDFRLESLRLAYSNLQAFVVHHTNKLDHEHLPRTNKAVNATIKAIYNPQSASEWVKAIQKYILSVLSYFLCFEQVEEESDEAGELLTLQMEALITSL
jgi:hypothetical protein